MKQTAPRALHPLLAEWPKETYERLAIYADLLDKWGRSGNLIGPASRQEIWVRHFADSLQVRKALPDARFWLDLGSGAGFPGLVTAITLAGDKNAMVHLIESNQRKCAFLRTVAREVEAPVDIHCGRIEAIVPSLEAPIEAVSARALAPLDQLLVYADKFLMRGATAVFSKGKQFEAELTPALTAGKYFITILKSETDPMARLLLIRTQEVLDLQGDFSQPKS
ncbi:MAG: 16S rRNA (guanine(527)-N(7))-methyltransferase RsmG [Alphaproteobacteria bacterium]|nr:16S rRNA (guanine(527)-N(7))-methyltransferase RsmG [Alphaproteobacteria bacterium]